MRSRRLANLLGAVAQRAAYLITFFCLFLSTVAYGVGQQVFPRSDLGKVAVGTVSTSNNLTFVFGGLSSPPTFSLLYGGEFALSPAVCDVTNSNCSVAVTLTPKYAGVRADVVIARDAAGHLLERLPVSGTGIGPQAMLSPGRVKPLLLPFNDPTIGFVEPQSMVLDPAGNLYFTTESSQVFKMNAVDYSVSLVAGTKTPGYSGDGGVATNAQLSWPRALAIDHLGNLFIADGGNFNVINGRTNTNNVIRKVDLATGLITTAIGNGTDGLTDSGPALEASLSTPYQLTIDPSGNIFFLEGVYTPDYKIRRLDVSTQELSVFAGTGDHGNTGDNGPAIDATIWPESITIGPKGDLYLVQQSGSFSDIGGVIRRISGDTISRYAGSDSGPNADGFPALSTSFQAIRGLSFDAAGNSYFVDVVNCCLGIRSISAVAPHTVTTLFYADAVAVNFVLNNIVLDASGAFYATDRFAYFEKILPEAAPITFSNTHPGLSSSPTYVILTNTGNAPLHLAALSLSGANPTDFSVTDHCGSVIAAGGNCRIPITFHPQAMGNRSASLVITDDAPGSPREVLLSGTGLTPQRAVVSPSSLDFGTQSGGTTSPTKTITLSNPGIAPLHITSITSSDPEFRVSSHCGTILASRATCIISVTFTPLQNHSAEYESITINEDASENPQMVGLRGTGTNVTLAATVNTLNAYLGIGSIYDFASQQVPIANTQTLTVTNTGNGWLDVSPGAVGPDASSFQTSADCLRLLPGETCKVKVTFFARRAGLHSATLFLFGYSAPPKDPLTVALSGVGFLQPETTSGGPGYLRVSADFDGDGKADIAFWRPKDGTWHIIPSSQPDKPITRQWGLNGDVATPGDYDGDGKSDLAVWRPSEGNWYIIPSSNPTAPIIRQWGLPGDIPVVGDFDGDGKADLTVWRQASGTWYNLPSRNPTTPIVQQWGLPGDIPLAADFDGDGKADFTVWRPAEGNWYVIRSSQPSNPTIQQWGLPGDTPVAADFDGDGRTDFAIWRPADGNWWLIPSGSSVPIVRQWGVPGDIPVPGDFNGDGKAEFAVWRPSSAQWFIASTDNSNPPVVQTWGDKQDVLLRGDFAKYGWAHVAAWNPNTGVWTVPAFGDLQTGIVQQWGLPGDVPLLSDFDGDGKADFTVWRPSDGIWRVLPSTHPSSPIAQQWGLPGDIPLTADLDYDGVSNFVVWRPSNGTWYILPSTQPSSPVIRQWGLPGDVPMLSAQGLYVRPELTVWRPSNGVWYAVGSLDAAPPMVEQWGLPGDVPLTEMLPDSLYTAHLIWRPSTHSWYLPPNVFACQMPIASFGSPGDIPITLHVPAMDGIGDTLNLWRPADGVLATYYPGSCTQNRYDPYSQKIGTPLDRPF